jgi:hypothetical protein
VRVERSPCISQDLVLQHGRVLNVPVGKKTEKGAIADRISVRL